jgi:hypothetical protein
MDRRQQAATPAAATRVRAAGRQRLRREVRGQAQELPSGPRLAVLEGTQQAVQGGLAATPPLAGLVAAARHQALARLALARQEPVAPQPAAEEGAGERAARPAAAEPADPERQPAVAAEQRQADRASARASYRPLTLSWAVARPTRSEEPSETPKSTSAEQPAFPAWACRKASAVREPRPSARSQFRRWAHPDPT